MYYFIKKEDVVEKYEVSVDKIKLANLRSEVINDCSEITHQEYDEFEKYFPRKSDIFVRNLKQTRLKLIDFNDLYTPSEYLYHFSYDEYKPPHLVTLIDKLLNDDDSVLDEIYHPTIDTKIIPFAERVKLANKQLAEIDDSDLESMKVLAKEVEELADQAILNKNQKPVMEYYKLLQNLINLNLVDTISNDELNRTDNFRRILK